MTAERTPSTPIAALGVLSAGKYSSRREAIRRTWLSDDYSEVATGVVVARFVVAVNQTRGDDAVAAEQTRHRDMLLLPTTVLSRSWSPLLTTFRWYALAARTVPFCNATFVAKLDDDVYVHVPELALHLRTLARTGKRHIYYGKFYFAMYMPPLYLHSAGALTRQAASKSGHGACKQFSQSCVGPFDHTTGSCQLLSMALASKLVASEPVLWDMSGAVLQAENASLNLARAHKQRSATLEEKAWRMVHFEDVWLGYAIHHLLGPSLFNESEDRQLHRVFVDAGTTGFFGDYYYDAKSWMQTNTTMFMHNIQKDERRMIAAHSAARSYHCMSNVSVGCYKASSHTGKCSEQHPTNCGMKCFMKPHVNKTCRVRRNLLATCKWSKQHGSLTGTECTSGVTGMHAE